MKTKLDHAEAFRSIIDQFDFEQVHKVMVALDWKWATSGFTVPTVVNMKLHCLRLLEYSYNKNQDISSGGFHVNNNGNSLSLLFVVDSAVANIDGIDYTRNNRSVILAADGLAKAAKRVIKSKPSVVHIAVERLREELKYYKTARARELKKS